MRACVIKSDAVVRLPPARMALELGDIRDEARSALAEAHAAAQKLLADARAAAAAELETARLARERISEAARTEGLERGRAEGRQTGLDEARQRFQQDSARLIELLRAAIEEVRVGRERLIDTASHDTLILAVAIARRVVSGAARIDPDVAVESARKALAAVRAGDAVAMHVNPADGQRLTDFAPNAGGAASIRVVPDEAVAAGGVSIHVGPAVVDATLAVQVERIADELLDDWRKQIATGEPPVKGQDA